MKQSKSNNNYFKPFLQGVMNSPSLCQIIPPLLVWSEMMSWCGAMLPTCQLSKEKATLKNRINLSMLIKPCTKLSRHSLKFQPLKCQVSTCLCFQRSPKLDIVVTVLNRCSQAAFVRRHSVQQILSKGLPASFLTAILGYGILELYNFEPNMLQFQN